jgi:2-furoate---CoA ligase
MQTVFELLRKAASRLPNAPAIADVKSGDRWTYRALVTRVERIAGGLASLGWRTGDRVAVVSLNTVEACIAILALHRAGIVPALMNPRLKSGEIAALVRDGGMVGCVLAASLPMAKSLLAEIGPNTPTLTIEGTLDGTARLADLTTSERDLPALQPPPDSPAFIFYTSGTTGVPKGVVIPQRAAEPRVLFMATQAGLTFGPHNRIAGVMPLWHVVGFFAVFVLALAFNGVYFLFREFEPRNVLAAIARHRLTSVFATPTHLDALTAALLAEDDLSSLDRVVFAGAVIPDAVLDRIRRMLPGRKVNIYGTTEAMNSLFMREPTSGTRLCPGFYSEVRVVRIGGSIDDVLPPGVDGELVVSVAGNDAAFTEYLGRPHSTREKLEAGWYRTSDAAVLDPDGDIEIKGRIDDMIISGGENIHPQQIEEFLLTHGGIRDVAVVGIPDQHWGQTIAAFIVPSHIGLSAADLDHFCRGGGLADFKRPRTYHFLADLPRNATGKVMRKVLVERVAVLAANCRPGDGDSVEA